MTEVIEKLARKGGPKQLLEPRFPVISLAIWSRFLYQSFIEVVVYGTKKN